MSDEDKIDIAAVEAAKREGKYYSMEYVAKEVLSSPQPEDVVEDLRKVCRKVADLALSNDHRLFLASARAFSSMLDLIGEIQRASEAVDVPQSAVFLPCPFCEAKVDFDGVRLTGVDHTDECIFSSIGVQRHVLTPSQEKLWNKRARQTDLQGHVGR